MILYKVLPEPRANLCFQTPAKAARPVHLVVCPFTPQLSQVLINRPRSDGMWSLRWYTVATSGIWTRVVDGKHGSLSHGHFNQSINQKFL